jgi:uncharacterized membrane protein YeaQ/YmgE (transglycosylase-associated protein family)
MEIITWLIVGLIAGALASAVVRGSGYGVAGDLVLGIAGAFAGGWTFREPHWRVPFEGAASTVAAAFLGAVVLLLAARFLKLSTDRTRRP